jgi:hypothetical protein
VPRPNRSTKITNADVSVIIIITNLQTVAISLGSIR